MAAGSPDSIRRAAKGGFNLLLDQIAPVGLSLERTKIYRDALEESGKSRNAGQIALARSLQIAETAEARGPGSERYTSDAEIAAAGVVADDSSLIGEPA